MMNGIALLLFMGAMGKSAQFPLHVWLPDAMEGPTPVSALIHAATMVNAGVYFIARANPIFAHASDGDGRRRRDRHLHRHPGRVDRLHPARHQARAGLLDAVSQLGYMFAGLGVGAFSAAIFHLMTHGFFKGLLFLGSGSVIHAVHDEQDMNRMGALWRKIPITHWTMLIGSIAIAGIPPLAGFFSKDEIIGASFKNGFYWVWAIGVIVAVMTGFYMFRLMGKTFYGESHVDPQVEPKIHESPWTMTLPLILLAIPAALLGFALGLPPDGGLIHQWLEPDLRRRAARRSGMHQRGFEFAGIDGGAAASSAPRPPRSASSPASGSSASSAAARSANGSSAGPTRLRPLYRASYAKWWFDDLNDLIFVRFGGWVARALWWFDARVIDGTVNGIAELTQGTGRGIRQIQTGRVQNYALGIAAGLLVIAVDLHVRGPLMVDTLRGLPLLVAGHVRAARRRADHRLPAR